MYYEIVNKSILQLSKPAESSEVLAGVRLVTSSQG